MVEPLRFRRPAVLANVPDVGHVVIEASAGTGKTYTLEHLVADLILRRGTDIDKLLIVTFTEAATAELRERIRGKFEEMVRLSDHQCDEHEPHWLIGPAQRALLQQQLDRFGRASIHTIHGFCRRLLVENAFHLRRLFDEEHADGVALFDRAFKRALRERFAVDDELAPYLSAWLRHHDIPDLAAALAGLIGTADRLEPRFSEASLRRPLDNLASLSGPELEQTLDGYAQCIARQAGSGVVATMMQRLVRRLVKSIAEYRSDADVAAVLSATDSDLLDVLEGPRWEENVFRRFVDVEPTPQTAEVSLHAAVRRLVPLRAAVLQRFLPTMIAALGTLKEAGLFDYDDMLTGVWDQMRDVDSPNARVLVDTIRKRYSVALIDEFQDTDPVQWNIFRRVFFESPDQQNRLVVIGDPKQAIYGFRGADVHTYIEARAAITDGDDERVVRLQQNFRSTCTLVDAYNTLFEQSARRPFFDGAIDYDAPVECGLPELHASRSGSAVVPVKLVRGVPRAEKIDAYDYKRTFGRWIAREIAHILGDGVRVVDPESDIDRQVGPSDIFVLVRNGVEARRMGAHLVEAGVPFAFYKEDGLFQSSEARQVLDLLCAVLEPHVDSYRLKAFATPFFAVPFDALHSLRDLADSHPLMTRLLEWNRLASRGEFERLFTQILDGSGIVRREILWGRDERALTNITHIFELLLEDVHQERAGLSDLILRLRADIDRASYSSSERNLQRLESDADAVQVMTIHKSKGLQADIVFVYGGMSARRGASLKRVCHEAGERVTYLGLPQSSAAMKVVADEERQEDQRLLYVAITRARAAVYLPYIATVRGKLQYTKLDGTYRVVNERVQAMIDEGLDPALFEVLDARVVDFDAEEGVLLMPAAHELAQWNLPDAADDPTQAIEALRSRPLVVSSYSRMKRTSEYVDSGGNREVFMLEFSQRAEAHRADDELPGGTDTGVFLHDILEHVVFADADATNFDAWRALPQISRLFDDAMATHTIDVQYRPYSERIVWQTLTTPLQLPGCTPLSGLTHVARDLREVEFLFPIPEQHSPAVDVASSAAFPIERGYLKGYIDLVFEHDGRVFFADWKSDTLASYEPQALAEHITSHYETQAWLYSLATLRMFAIHDEATFEARFGGFMYAFVRGADAASGTGFYVNRPTFAQIVAYEESLVTREFR